MLTPLPKVNVLAHLFDLDYQPTLKELQLRIQEEKHKKHMEDNEICSYNMPHYFEALLRLLQKMKGIHPTMWFLNQNTS